MAETVVVIGAPGVGKDTVVEESLPLAEDEYDVVSFSDRFNEKCTELGYIGQWGEEVTLEEFRHAIEVTTTALAEEIEGKDTVVIHHATIQIPNGFMPALSSEMLRELDATRLVQIKANPEEVPQRIEERERREGAVKRSARSPTEIERQQNREFEFATAAAVGSAAPLMTVRNENGKLEQAAASFADILNSTI